jgi:hypothetical protein
MTEEFRDIKDYEGFYRVSNLGRVTSLPRVLQRSGRGGNMKVEGRIMVGSKRSGYKTVLLTKNKVIKNIYVHKLVAAAFVGMRPKKHDINHKNGIKTDNRVENLEYCTRSENNIHAIENGLWKLGQNCYNSVLTNEQVIEIKKVLKRTEAFRGMVPAIARRYKVKRKVICAIKNGKSWKHIKV